MYSIYRFYLLRNVSLTIKYLNIIFDQCSGLYYYKVILKGCLYEPYISMLSKLNVCSYLLAKC
jgi:hypothetical protein